MWGQNSPAVAKATSWPAVATAVANGRMGRKCPWPGRQVHSTLTRGHHSFGK
jgi:hypothetical protein